MRNILLAAGFVGLVVSIQACGDSKHAGVLPDAGSSAGGKGSGVGGKSSGGKSSGGSTTQSDAGVGGEPEPAVNGPVVKITSPSAAETPDDGVLTTPTVKVLCSVTASSAAGASEVDLTTIKIAIEDADGKVLETKDAGATTVDNEYTAEFVLATVQSGAVTFTCSAKDKQALLGQDKLATFVDHGPTITPTSPQPDGAYPLKGGLSVDFTVKPTLLAKDDAGAAVDTVEFTLDGKKQDVKEVSPGQYQTTLQLDDLDAFPVTPTGAISITATNVRKPKPVTATEAYNIVIDGAGPVIMITDPIPQEVVGGKQTLTFTVKDDGSGVDEKSVNVSLWEGQEPPIYFDPDNGWSHVGSEYKYTFDTKVIEPHKKVQTTINVRASDAVGNSTPIGQSVQIYLDNVPPQIDLDPRNIRILGNSGKCSGSFDPVGSKAVNDLDGVMGDALLNPIGYFRTFVLEQTNSEPGQDLFYYSGTKPGTVRLYIQADPENAATKLLINKNPLEDNTCDDIGGLDDVKKPPFSGMNPINANGSSGGWYSQDDGGIDPVVVKQCTLSNEAPAPNLCPAHSSDLWYDSYATDIKEPRVYVVGTPKTDDASCAGIQLSFLSLQQPDGWVCAAARVEDNAGNIGISPPIRLCVTRDTNNPPACRIMSTTPPSCTDGCTPPARGGNIIVR
ncbi:MAG TPA: hypothetical protein VHB79_33915 [Polyangiaceae bacterium]|nr:hypothetical protein [Polyangiaceae bacterium]